MYLFIYKTTHVNGKYYIGRHQTKNINDGYLGSGKWVKSIKDKTKLNKEILKEAKSFEELCQLEEHYINSYWDDPLCMNYKKKSIGADFGETNPMFGMVGELNPMFHRRGKDHPSYGKKHSLETCKKKSKALKGKSYEELHGKEKATQIKNKLKIPKSEEHKQKLSKPKNITVCRIIDKREMSLSNFMNWYKKKPRIGNTYTFYDINMKVIEINNLKIYCETNDLNYNCMRKVAAGTQKIHKGYTICQTQIATDKIHS
jgi:hypothetical protein